MKAFFMNEKTANVVAFVINAELRVLDVLIDTMFDKQSKISSNRDALSAN